MTPEIWSALIGAFMPYLTEIIKVVLPEKRWVGYSLALGLCVGIGSGSAYFGGQFDTQNILASIGSALIASQSVYNYWFKNKQQDKKISNFVKELVN